MMLINVQDSTKRGGKKQSIETTSEANQVLRISRQKFQATIICSNNIFIIVIVPKKVKET